MLLRVPDSVERKLSRDFNGRYRLRWSVLKNQWHLEQKVGVGQADPPFRVSEADDSMIRAIDGYALVMTIEPQKTFSCRQTTDYGTGEQCGAPVRAPLLHTSEVRCGECAKWGRDGRNATAFYPLESEELFTHIRHIDYYTGHNQNIAKGQDEANRQLMATRQKDDLNEIDAVSYDLRKTIGGIEQVGYGGSIIRPVGD